MILELAKLALRNLSRRKVRSALTLIGIWVGMTAIVALISLGQGIQQAIDSQFSRIGYDLVLILPGISGGSQSAGPRPLDITLLSALEGAAQMGTLLRQTLPVQAVKLQGSLTVIGLSVGMMPLAHSLVGGYEFSIGRNFEPGRAEIVVGSEILKNWELTLGQTLLVNQNKFTIVGVLEPSTSDEQYNHMIFMSLDELYALTGEPNLISLAVVKAGANIDVTQLAQRAEKILADKGVRDFTVQNSKQLSDVVGNILRIIQVALASIAAIALVVGGIGLANTMYTSVLERTREIGLLKALGAKRKHIRWLFLIESSFLGFMGGLLGLIFGISLSQSMALLARQAIPNLRFGAGISFELVLGALLISVVLGAAAGLWPAMRASRLHPVVALRYE
jgi:putative ABC transport system permease protein